MKNNTNDASQTGKQGGPVLSVKEVVKSAFKNVIESTSYDEKVITQYFHPEYKQIVDGKSLDYAGFCTHMQVLKKKIQEAK